MDVEEQEAGERWAMWAVLLLALLVGLLLYPWAISHAR